MRGRRTWLWWVALCLVLVPVTFLAWTLWPRPLSQLELAETREGVWGAALVGDPQIAPLLEDASWVANVNGVLDAALQAGENPDVALEREVAWRWLRLAEAAISSRSDVAVTALMQARLGLVQRLEEHAPLACNAWLVSTEAAYDDLLSSAPEVAPVLVAQARALVLADLDPEGRLSGLSRALLEGDVRALGLSWPLEVPNTGQSGEACRSLAGVYRQLLALEPPRGARIYRVLNAGENTGG